MSGDDKQTQEPEDVVIARVIRARGIKGEVACDLSTDFPERFGSLDEVAVNLRDGGRRRLRVERHWFHKGRVILKFDGFDTRNAAEDLVGASLVISESQRMPLEEGEFFEYEIVGSEVTKADGTMLGRVIRLMRTGGTDLLVVTAEGGREHLIPFTDDICVAVDVEERRILVSPPEGLLDL